MEWIPRVVDEERKAYEQAAKQDGFLDFAIREQDISKQMVRAKSRIEYFPVYFVEPYKGNQAALGFDLASNPSRLQALQTARDREKAIATAPITLIQTNESSKKGFLVFSPVYQNNVSIKTISDRRKHLEGFALGVFLMGDIVEKTLQDYQFQDIDVLIINDSAPLKDRILFASNPSLTPETIDSESDRTIAQSYKLNFAGQQWSVVTQSTSKYILQHTTWHPWGVLGGGILLTMVLTSYISNRITLEEKLRTKGLQLAGSVKQKTDDLKTTEAKYRHIFENVAEGIFLCTQDGKYVNVNPALVSIYGYDSSEQLIAEINKQQLFVNSHDWQKLTTELAKNTAIADFECQIYRADNSKIWVSLSIRLFQEQNQNYYEGTVSDISDRKKAEEDLRHSNNLLQGISLAQSRFIKDSEPAILFDGLLENLLEITNSEYGFIGEIFYTDGGEPYIEEAYMKMQGQPYLKTHAITNIAWDEATRKLYEENAVQGMEFHNLNTLFGAVIVTGQPVIANNPQTDPRRGGLPPGHPPLNTFLGLPFYSQNLLLGMVGVANRPDGYDRDLVEYLQPFMATCSNIIEASGSERKRKKIEIALKESEKRYRSIVDTANEGILLLNIHGKISFVNPRVCQMLGYELEEILERSLFDFLDHSNQERITLASPISLNCDSKTIKDYDLQFCRRDGSKLWAIAHISLICTYNSNCEGILVMIADISDRKQAEIELAAAKHSAEMANRTKSHFLAHMSHELRTPLNGILGSVRLLKKNLSTFSDNQTLSSSNLTKSLNTIEHSGSYLLGLIEDILDFAQMETTSIKLSPTAIKITTFVEEILAIVRSQAMAQNLSFTSEIPSNLPLGIEADRQRLKQILLELLNNALKFTNQGRVTLRIVVIEPSEPSESLPIQAKTDIHKQDLITLRFEVIDTGKGISPEELVKIFLPFEQSGEIHNKAAGTGLELTIIQQLLHFMNSDLKVTSSLNMGSTFWFDLTLPIVKNFVIEDLAESDSIVGYQGEKRKLLVADDKQENRLHLLNILEPLGFEVFLAENGQQEIEIAQKVNPDLILTDLVMPIKTGFEAVEELRRIPDFQHTPIIAVSSSILTIDSKQNQIAGCDAFLVKPIDKQKLLIFLQKSLQLLWIHQEKTEPIGINYQQTNSKIPDLIAPPKEKLEALYELAMLGSMKKIRQWAIALEELDVQYHPFASQLKQLSQGFQEKAIVNLVEQYLSQK